MESGGLTVNNKYYAFNNIYRWAWHGSLIAPGTIFAVFVTELLCVGWQNSSLRLVCFRRTASFWSDIALYIGDRIHFTRFLSIILTFGLSFLSFEWLHSYIVNATGYDFGLHNLPVTPQFIVALFLYTFFDYWSHRFEQTNIIWPLHRFHHAAEDFCILTAVRVHPFALISFFLISAPLILLGTSPAVFTAVNIFVSYIRFLIHSRIPGQWGWTGRWILQSADGHRKHHILDEAYAGKNFALMPLWDHLFGTWSPACSQQTSIGVHFPYRQGAWFIPDMWRDYCQCIGNIYTSLRFPRPAANSDSLIKY
jgi:sterol desaturase/sphingolipid hydroxylase (fatty acid hydroxylase superfamily)